MTDSISDVNINLTDVVTFNSCTTIVCEIIKYLIYQRQQIPYPYEQLKNIIKRRKELQLIEPDEGEGEIPLHIRISAEREFSKAQEAYETLENVFKHIDLEIRELSTEHCIKEFVVIFGATPFHPKNIFNIKLPPISYTHLDENHPPSNILNCLFRSLLSSDELNSIVSKQLGPTNTFILLKTDKTSFVKSESFHQKDYFKMSPKTVHLNFTFTPNDQAENKICCYEDDVTVFFRSPPKSSCTTDVCKKDSQNLEDCNGENEEDESNWFQFNDPIKGFKNCNLNGTPVANLWLKCVNPSKMTS